MTLELRQTYGDGSNFLHIHASLNTAMMYQLTSSENAALCSEGGRDNSMSSVDHSGALSNFGKYRFYFAKKRSY